MVAPKAVAELLEEKMLELTQSAERLNLCFEAEDSNREHWIRSGVAVEETEWGVAVEDIARPPPLPSPRGARTCDWLSRALGMRLQGTILEDAAASMAYAPFVFSMCRRAVRQHAACTECSGEAARSLY